jgi:hypothetical protein
MDTLRRIVSGFVLAILVLASIALALYGADRLTQATLGVGVICLAVFVAVIARIAQAADHHAALRILLERAERV